MNEFSEDFYRIASASLQFPLGFDTYTNCIGSAIDQFLSENSFLNTQILAVSDMTVKEEIGYYKDQAERYRKMAEEFQKEEERFQWNLTIAIGVIAIILWAIMFVF